MRWLLLSVVSFAGCASSPADTTTGDSGETGTTIGCETDPRAQTFTANMERAGESGALKFVLVSIDPAPALRGNNTWTLKLLDGAGHAVPDATIDILPFMPEHGHGTSVVAKATAKGDGTYTIAPLSFFMPGLWRVTFTAKAGTASDTAAFFFCVAG